ncbi:anti-sigma factor [Actinomyces sp. B33]|uniref:anti-sigma factor n=1 Tax=Actinomyces sp. B33 TaxID=2942131 RepID=UPI00233FD00F|nr:anti-sigma factor [Actinomyces sp. B33]MDC4233819.1 anti-sigma factor [Actinomyces sp. B33]
MSRMKGDGRGVAGVGDDCEGVDREVAGILGASLTPVAPPERIRAALLDEISRTAQDDPIEAPTPLRSDRVPGGRAPVEEAEGATVVEFRPRRVTRWLSRAAAAAAVVVVGLGGYQYGRMSTMETMSDATSYAKLNQMQDVERASDTMPDGHIATLTWSESMDMAAVALPAAMTEGMDGEDGPFLHVWVRRNGVVESAGVYEPSRGMEFSFIHLMPAEGTDVLVTQEPSKGADRPTGEPLVVIHVGARGGAPEGLGSGSGSAAGSAAAVSDRA